MIFIEKLWYCGDSRVKVKFGSHDYALVEKLTPIDKTNWYAKNALINFHKVYKKNWIIPNVYSIPLRQYAVLQFCFIRLSSFLYFLFKSTS